MRSFALFLLVFVVRQMAVEGACCFPPCIAGQKYVLGFLPSAVRLCGDCTNPTPYCGYGRCNIFGCNCDGGCRVDICGNCTVVEKRHAVLSPMQGDEFVSAPFKDHLGDIFETADQNQDGLLDQPETMSWLRRNKRDAGNFEFLELDTNKDGFLSPDEIDP